jgi:hypothetical protein
MTITELRRILKNHPKYPNTIDLSRVSLVNDGYPGTFNLSMMGAECIEQYGQNLEYTHNYCFSKIGQMIRFNDWEENFDIGGKFDLKDSYRYLGLFHMSDMGGEKMIKNGRSQMSELTQQTISSLVDMLVNKLGLDIKNFRISYHPGGSVKQITHGKYSFDKYIPVDPSIDYWYDLGFRPENFFVEVSRNTVLALNNFEYPSPWGYRNEIHYLHNGKMLDIATVEQLCFRPIFARGSEIIGLTDWDHGSAVNGVGLERLLMVLNDLDSIHDLEHIKNLSDFILSYSSSPNTEHAICLNETLRPIQAILGDVFRYENLSKNRKIKYRQMVKNTVFRAEKLGLNLSREFLGQYFNLNSDLQVFYPELREDLNAKIEDFLECVNRLITALI